MVVATRTRSGRHIKKPVLFQPAETVLEDDYATDEHDTDIDSEIDTDDEDEYSSEEEEDEEANPLHNGDASPVKDADGRTFEPSAFGRMDALSGNGDGMGAVDL